MSPSPLDDRRAPSWGERRRWGVTCQLATTRSAASWGVGDFADLATLGQWLRTVGGDVVAVSPLGDQMPLSVRQDSPYYASSRRWLDPIHIRVEHVEHDPGIDLGDLAAAARRLNDEPLVDRTAAWSLKETALRRIFDHDAWAEPGRHDDDTGSFEDFVERGGTDLAGHARFCALARRYDSGWPGWPADPEAPPEAELRFWSWLQWLADAQLRDAASACDLVGDLPVGCDPSGADAWADRDLLATQWRVGAPPDEFNRAGQDWGIAPYDPTLLAASGHRPLRAMLAANGDRFAGLRIDHVMGLFRLWWVPVGGSPADGHYVEEADDAQLALVVDAARAHHAFVVGEDLGTVAAGVRERLRHAGIAGMAVAWFEDRDPREWPELSVAMLTTHDLPTVLGALGDPDEHELAARIRRFAACGDDADDLTMLVEAHRRLAGSSSGMALATLEDLCGSPHRVNRPGTVDEYPNWRHALPVRLDDLGAHPVVRANVAALATRR